MTIRVVEYELTRTQSIWVRVEVADPKDDAAAAIELDARSHDLWREYERSTVDDRPRVVGVREHDHADGSDFADLAFDDGSLHDWTPPAVAPDLRHAVYIDGIKWATCGTAVVRLDTALRRAYWYEGIEDDAIARMLDAPPKQKIALPDAVMVGGQTVHVLSDSHGLDPDLLVDMRDGDEIWSVDVGMSLPAYKVMRGDEVIAVVASRRL